MLRRPMPLVAALALAVAGLAATPAGPPSPTATGAAWAMALDRFGAGRDALAAKRWAEAEAAFLEAIRLQPSLAVAHYGLGQALMAQGRYPEAADAYLSCRNVFGSARRGDAGRAREMEVRELRDTLAALAGRHALTADRFLEMQLEKRLADLDHPGATGGPWSPPGVTMALGTAYFQAGALAEAEREFLSILRADPSSGDAENNLAVLYVAMDRAEEAEAAIARAEKDGVKVSPRLKDEVRRRRGAGAPPRTAGSPPLPPR
jgi:tetratricopeptide (TPR) repeat protein